MRRLDQRHPRSGAPQRQRVRRRQIAVGSIARGAMARLQTDRTGPAVGAGRPRRRQDQEDHPVDSARTRREKIAEPAPRNDKPEVRMLRPIKGLGSFLLVGLAFACACRNEPRVTINDLPTSKAAEYTRPATGPVTSRPAEIQQLYERLAGRGVGVAEADDGRVVALEFDTDFTDNTSRLLEKMPRLDSVQELHCGSSDITWPGVTEIPKKFPNVLLIDLRNAPIADAEDLDVLKDLKMLKVVYVSQMTDEQVERLESIVKFRVIVGEQGKVGNWLERIRRGESLLMNVK